jgi:hypothetical protein
VETACKRLYTFVSSKLFKRINALKDPKGKQLTQKISKSTILTMKKRIQNSNLRTRGKESYLVSVALPKPNIRYRLTLNIRPNIRPKLVFGQPLVTV